MISRLFSFASVPRVTKQSRGGLIFTGESTGDFLGLDATTGKRLWRFATGAGVNAPPITYRAGGRQFIAVASGGHTLFNFPLGDAVIAFALPN